MITKKDMQFFKAAKREAEKSNFKNFHVGCVVVYKNHVIGKGHNSHKTSPQQKKWNRERNFYKDGKRPVVHSIHAEMRALTSIPYPVGIDVNWSKVKVYVYRICKGKPSHKGLSKPCAACRAAIRSLGIHHVYFTEDDGYGYIKLDKEKKEKDA